MGRGIGGWLAGIVACVALAIPATAGAYGFGFDGHNDMKIKLKRDFKKDVLKRVFDHDDGGGDWKARKHRWKRHAKFKQFDRDHTPKPWVGDNDSVPTVEPAPKPTVPAVPEPSAALVFSMGMLVAGSRLRRGRR